MYLCRGPICGMIQLINRESRRGFFRPRCLEHYVLNRLRNDETFIPELDVVIELDGQIIGQNMFMQNEIKVYLDGGWGVDALLKRESRIHNDIDLFVELKHYHDYIYVIKQHGFEEVNTDYTTDGHTVWKDDKQRIIDLHCFEFTDDGIVYEGDIFPSKTFSGIGKVGDITVSCIEPLSQVMLHLGYEHDKNDVHDVMLLCETFQIAIPDEYKEK